MKDGVNEKFSNHHLSNYPLPNRTITPPKMKIQKIANPYNPMGVHIFMFNKYPS